MKMHANARLSLKGRELLIDRVENAGWSLSAAAEAAGISDRTARKWIARYRAEGPRGLLDRSSAPAVVANRTDERRVEVIAALRRLRMTGAEIAELLEMALSTVSGILTRIGMGKLGRLGLEPAQRYERARPGELIHIDVKKLGRIHGGAGKRVHRLNAALHTATSADADGVIRAHGRLGIRSRRDRRRDPPGLRRGPRRREGDHRRRVPAPRGRALRRLRHHRRATDHRQRLRLPLNRSTRSRAAPSGSATSAPAPTDPRPTAKPNDSSAPCSAAGPTARSTATAHERNAALAGWLDFYNRRRPHGALSHKPP